MWYFTEKHWHEVSTTIVHSFSQIFSDEKTVASEYTYIMDKKYPT
jgi:hypothetical protein